MKPLSMISSEPPNRIASRGSTCLASHANDSATETTLAMVQCGC
jgi:hypothetical protein